MKIKITPEKYSRVISKDTKRRARPSRPNIVFRTLMKLAALPTLKLAKFKCTKIGLEELHSGEPCLFIMNSSGNIDYSIIASALYPRPYNIVTGYDSFAFSATLARLFGCIPAKRFAPDTDAAKDVNYAIKHLGSSVVIFPEELGELDGSPSDFSERLGEFIKKLGVSVAVIHTYGAYLRKPAYTVQKRSVPLSADVKLMLTRKEVKAKSAQQINELLREEFSQNCFEWQKENVGLIDAPFRADCLERILYKCPHCYTEGKMLGKDTTLSCSECGASYKLDELGALQVKQGKPKFRSIPDWYRWQGECLKAEIASEDYSVSLPVRICMSASPGRIYYVGSGTLTHTKDGFALSGANGKLSFKQSAKSSRGVYVAFNWRSFGDVIALSGSKATYYCFPEVEQSVIAKLRLAAREAHKISKDATQ